MALTLGPVIGQIGQKYTTHAVAAFSVIFLPIDGTPTSVAVVTSATASNTAVDFSGTVTITKTRG